MKLCFYQRISLALAAVFICVLALFFFTSAHLQSITQDEAEQQLHLGLAELNLEDALQHLDHHQSW